MNNFLQMLMHLLFISAIFFLVAIIAVTLTSSVTQGNIHPDYWVIGAPEKIVTLVIFLIYLVTVVRSVKSFTRKNH